MLQTRKNHGVTGRLTSSAGIGRVSIRGSMVIRTAVAIAAAAGWLGAQAPTGSTWISASGGNFFSVAVASDGSLWGWGRNSNGQLGIGTKIDSMIPVRAGTANNWVYVASSWLHCLGIKADGTLWSWGYNGYGNVGDGTKGTDRTVPVQVGSGNNWIMAFAGERHSVGLKSDGTIWTWGNNAHGQLGDGTAVDKVSPVQVGTDTNWIAVAGGAYHNIAIKADGSLWSWGANGNTLHGGQLGDGTKVDKFSPVRVGTDTDWRAVAAGLIHSVALKADGSLWVWGGNHMGELGLNDYASRLTPVRLGTETNWTALNAKNDTTHALKTDGSLWGWGDSTYGQLGDGTNTRKLVPVRIGTDADWSGLGKGHYHALGRKSDGSLWAWGRNDYGQLGDGTTSHKNSPVRVDIIVTPILSIDPGSLSFADQTEGTTSTTLTVTVTNRGTSTLSVGSISNTGANPADFIRMEDNCSLANVAPSGSCVIRVAFSPSGTGARSAALSIPSNAPGSPHSVALAGTGLSAALPSVRVVSPNGGERIFTGSSYLIEWTASSSVGLSSFDVLYSSDGGTTFVPLPGCVGLSASARSCLWASPGPATSVGRIRVTARDTSGGSSSDASDASYSVLSGSGSITVTAPNTAVTWVAGTAQQIRWNHNLGTASYVRIELSRDGGATWSILDPSFRNNGATSSTYNWMVTGPATSQARVKVSWTSGPSTDVSDVNFLIALPYITVSTPNLATVNWGTGTGQEIRWASNLPATEAVRILLSVDNGVSFTTVLAASTVNDKVETITVPNTPSSTARVRIEWTGNSSIGDASDAGFTIAAPFLTVSRPNGGEKWAVGSTQTISWSSNLGSKENVSLELSADGGVTWSTLVGSTPSDGSQAVVVPSVTAPSCLVRIAWLDNPTVRDSSNAVFDVRPPYLTLISPNGGQVWAIGTTQLITWSSNLSPARILLSTDSGATWTQILASTTNTSYYWTVPSSASSQARIRIESLAAGLTNYSDSSDGDFTIAPAFITVTAPNGGEIWLAGSSRTITWSSNVGGNVRIELSRDGGGSWTTLLSSTVNDGSQPWTTTSPASANCLIRITSTTLAGATDVSNAAFTIQ